jgi:hypothetical protein
MHAELRMTFYTCLAVLTIAVQGFAQQRYTLTDLGIFTPRAIAGPWVVGVDQPIIPGGVPIRLNLDTGEAIVLPHAGFGAHTTAVLDTGETIGNIWQPFPNGYCCGDTWGALWDTNGNVHYLPGSAAHVSTFAWGINGHQTIAGQVYIASLSGDRAARWRSGQPPEIFGTLGGNTSQGFSIDAQGRMWGSARTAGSEDWPITARTHAAVFHVDGRVQDLGTLDGQYSGMSAVSPEGVGVGTSGAWAFTATVEGGITALPILTGFHYCSGRSIASGGASVGHCTQYGGAPHLDIYHATLWPSASPAVDLNTVANTGGWVLESATGISAEGEIVGTMISQGQRRGYLLTPITAPPSLAIRLNQSTFQPGETLRVTLDLSNPGPMLTTDVYVGIILPDGEQVVFLTNLSPLEGQLTTLSSNPRLFARLLQGVSWPANLHATQENYWVYTRSGLEANGTYHLVVAWTKPNSLQDGSIDEGDILALDWKAFRFTGPASNLAAKVQEIRARHATE